MRGLPFLLGSAIGFCVCASALAEPPSGEPVRGSWIDSSYDYLTSTTDSLAQRFDAFFGEPDAERESADSVLRLVSEYELSEDEGGDATLRLRGKVDLPRLNRKLSLVFGEENDFRNDVLPPSGSAESDVGIQYRVVDHARSRLDASFGTNASLDLRAGLRYRYIRPLGERFNLRLSERIYLKQDDGAGTISRGDLDYRLGAGTLLRFTSDVEYGEETDGAEWGGRASVLRQIDPRQAVSLFTAVSGQTDPRHLTNAYAVGVRYRRNVLRPWIFLEVEPAHLWRRDSADEPRKPAWAVSVRIELLEELKNRRAGN